MNEIYRSIIGIREPGSLGLVQSLLRQGITVRIRVSGNSMQPLLKGGEIVEVEMLPKTKPQLGDILFICDRMGNPIVHRLIWRRIQNGTLHLITKGDSCTGFDGFVSIDRVLGRVKRIIPETKLLIDLNAPLQRLQASQIVIQALIIVCWRRIVKLRNNIFLLISL